MDKTAEANFTTQLKQLDLDERPSRAEQERVLAVEAHHRLRLLDDD